ncbi:hypothetical protein [Hahella ganghwensis]|uniref:RIFT barrel domain-containing protein n=1 Tax=Hahella ganghwensis TaxID=286420 RepID=UPI0003601228|nr:hypothetical protein [Hahella ganghwensis]
MFSIPIQIDGREAGSGNRRMAAFACPFPKGALHQCTNLVLTGDSSQLPLVAEVTARWPDSSVKWLHFETMVNVTSQDRTLFLEIDKTANHPDSEVNEPFSGAEDIVLLDVATSDGITTLFRGTEKYEFSGAEQDFELRITGVAGSTFLKGPVIKGKDGAKIPFDVENVSHEEIGEGPLKKVVVTVNGAFEANHLRKPVNGRLRFAFLPFTSLVELEFTAHNPNAAKHLNGHWDLGDPGSFVFVGCHMDMQCEVAKAFFQLNEGAEWQSSESAVVIYQGGSGGERWNSPVHVNADNKIPVQQRGYTVHAGDGKKILEGLRASPALLLDSPGGRQKGIFIRPVQFWQNFPKSLELTEQGVSLEFFPSRYSGPHELQAGEKKTHRLLFSAEAVAGQFDWLSEPVSLAVDSGWVASCRVIPGLIPASPLDEMEEIINLGLSHPQHSFMQKREAIDEYGWRNFGDIYADHETAEHKEDSLFVSHYNNQYDPVMGMLRQYLATGNPEWFHLADDLARHVSDIDIYDTEDDKFEYNRGLFWHTDHYVDAQTATHRTYSSRQKKGVYQDHAGGGGPGGQHCYTTGLMYHYFLTGNRTSKESVLQLTEWIRAVYEGDNGLLEYVLALKNASNPGLKNPLSRRYPLDRGTGNYLVALLDSYQITLDDRYLQHSAQVIRNTVNPAEDIALRNLQNVEETWFYTIFLQAVVKYLMVKIEAGQFDEDFYYARDSLLHFADWMLKYEYPYLEKPEILEFPNHTWVAQDARKPYLLTYAAMFCSDLDKRQLLIEKAAFFEHYVIENLKHEQTNYYTRILAILMQNHGPGRMLKCMKEHENWQELLGIPAPALSDSGVSYPAPQAKGRGSLWAAALLELSRRMLGLSISRELGWLAKRSEKVAAWLNR